MIRHLKIAGIIALLLGFAAGIPVQAQTPPANPLKDKLTALGGYPCPDSKLTCVKLTVPLDYADPTGKTIQVVFGVLPATGASKGMFTVVTGGPGSSGLAVADSDIAAYDRRLQDKFDIVFFDQRGMGLSNGMECPKAVGLYNQEDDTLIQIAGGRDELKQAARNFAVNCVAEINNPSMLANVRTDEATNDLEMFRDKLGEDKIWLYGQSYGTNYVQRYATLHPEHVAGVILDGVLNLTDPPIGLAQSQAVGFQKAVLDTLKKCDSDTACANDMGGSAATYYDQLTKQLIAAPLTVDFPLPTGESVKRPLTIRHLESVSGQSMYAQSFRPEFLRTLAAAHRGDYVPMLRMYYALNSIDPKTLDFIPTDTSSAMFYGVVCSENSFFSGTPDDRANAYLDNGAALEKTQPYNMTTYYDELPCVYWNPTPQTQPVRPAFVDKGIPTFILNATDDPATPMKAGIAVFEGLDNGYMVTQRGGPHVIYGRRQACPDNLVNDFLLNDKLPDQRQFVCPGDVYSRYVPLRPDDVSQYDNVFSLMQGIDETITFLPEQFLWKGKTEVSIACPFGGIYTFGPVKGGQDSQFTDCAFVKGFILNGKGQWTFGDNLTYTLTVSGTASGQLGYTYNFKTAMYTISGTYGGKAVTPVP